MADTSARRRVVHNINEDASIGNDTNKNGSRIESTQPSIPRDNQHASSFAAILAAIFSPALITTLALIFGGCCSNVYSLEAILSLSPATGHLITFLQFVLIALTRLPSQVTTNGLRQRTIPLQKWALYSVMFVAVNVLNNAAFNYKISLPLHIILRSAGPVTSMLLGYALAGKRYSSRKVFAVAMLFIGVVTAAISDADRKKRLSRETLSGSMTAPTVHEQWPGFVLVTLALLISATLGIYSDGLYQQYGRSQALTDESIFYSHVLSMPFFATQLPTLRSQYTSLTTNSSFGPSSLSYSSKWIQYLPEFLKEILPEPSLANSVPWLLLAANALTQIICITGVHRLSTQTSSLTVSIVLNIRKLVSLLLSIWLFGNQLPMGVAVGAVLVFSGGGLYGIPDNKAKGTNARKQT